MARGAEPGNEIQSPMALVILGGLLSSTLLNIFVVPILYYVNNKKKTQVIKYEEDFIIIVINGRSGVNVCRCVVDADIAK